MKIVIDEERQTLAIEEPLASPRLASPRLASPRLAPPRLASPRLASPVEYDLYSTEAFEALSELWLKIGWNQKYVYGFSWLGRPIIQLPEDMIRMQEVIYNVKPDVIVETGIAHGGGMVFYASLCKLMGRGHVVGVELELRSQNRQALEGHELSGFMSIVDGSSTDPAVVDQVRQIAASKSPGGTVIVILDSNHSKAHVRDELEAYAPLVTPGSYLVATDGSMEMLADVPRAQSYQAAGSDWRTDNPKAAVEDFVLSHPEYALEEPVWPFNESELRARVTHWPSCFLRRLSGGSP